MKQLEKSKLEEDLEKRKVAKKLGKDSSADDETRENSENNGDSNNAAAMSDLVKEYQEAGYGVSQSKVITTPDDMIDDKYGVSNEVDKSKLKEEKRDLQTVKREEFLKIYKEEGKNKQQSEDDASNPDSNRIKFRPDNEAEIDIELKTQQMPTKKPLITEIGSGPSITEDKKEKEIVDVPFSWTDAQRIELKPQFIAQADFVFLNLPLKGYKPDEDVRYALSPDEILLEIRDRTAPKGTSRVRRLCQTLSKQIDVPLSEVQLLVDFICVKLCKLEKGASWTGLGYEIADFTIPERS